MSDNPTPETLSISEASTRMGVSVSTLRRRLSKGQIEGAHKATGPDGLEWRVPVSSIPDEIPVQPIVQLSDELVVLRQEVNDLKIENAQLKERALKDQEIKEMKDNEIRTLSTLMAMTLEKVPRAIETSEQQEKRRKWFKRDKKLS
jgi:DNA invertase Pin-like site-specific DNA recombinase